MATDLQSLEQRVTALEKLVGELQSRVGTPTGQGRSGVPDWIARWAVSDEEGLEEVYRLGREFRETGRVPDEADDRP
jgi:hypothetical protein